MDEWNDYMKEVKQNRVDAYAKHKIEERLIKKGCTLVSYEDTKGDFVDITHPEHGRMFYYPSTKTLRLFKYKQTIKKKGKTWLLENIINKK